MNEKETILDVFRSPVLLKRILIMFASWYIQKIKINLFNITLYNFVTKRGVFIIER